jgi:RNA polymerase sigma factor (sigma-70 family)
MVQAVCRRRLGDTPDADDAVQAVFVLLARDATKVRRRESLAGYLYRVAYLVALKAAGRAARRAVAPLPPDEVAMPSPPPDHAAQAAELKASIDAELAALPDRFRGPAVLCLVEGRTNAEAAAVLGVPVGTVDSRLHTARQKLRAGLLRRGIASAAVGGWEAAAPRAATAGEAAVAAYIRTAIGEAAIPAGVLELTQVVPTMTTTTAKALAAGLIGLGLLGGTGAGVYLAAAGDPPAEKKPAEQARPRPEAKPGVEIEVTLDAVKPAADARAALDRPSKMPAGVVALRDLFQQIEDEHQVIVRVDMAAFRRLVTATDGGDQLDPEFLKRILDLQVELPRQAARLPLRDLLSDVLARSSARCAVQVRGDQLVIVPAYQPITRPGEKGDETSMLVPENVIAEQMWGPPVTLAADDQPLERVLADLRKQTGANIILDARCKDKREAVVSASATDVRLLSALRVVADMADLDAVWMNNVFYVTTKENAERLERKVREELFGKPTAPAPAKK